MGIECKESMRKQLGGDFMNKKEVMEAMKKNFEKQMYLYEELGYGEDHETILELAEQYDGYLEHYEKLCKAH